MSCTRELRFNETVHGITISHDGQRIAVGMLRGEVLLLDACSGKLLTRLDDGDSFAVSIAFSSACLTPLLLAIGSADGFVRVWDCSSYVCVARHASLAFNRVHCVTFSPNGRLLAASSGRTVQLWYTNNWNAPPVMLDVGVAWALHVAFSCDSSLLATNADSMSLWRIRDESDVSAVSITNLMREAGDVSSCLAFSPVDRQLLACGNDVGNIVLSKVVDRALVVERDLQGHTHCVWSVAFSPCGKQLVSASCDKTARLWSVARGTCLCVLQGHTWIVFGAYFFHNGKQLASGSYDDTLRIWTVCPWNDRVHHLFGAQLKMAVFTLMCVRARLEQKPWQGQELRRSSRRAMQLPRLPMEVWLLVFEQLALVQK